MDTTVALERAIAPDSDAKTSGDARTRILAALRDLTLASGVDAVSVRGVVARAGVARSTFYEYLEKEMTACRLAEAQVGVISAWLVAGGSTPVDAVATIIGTAARSCAEALLETSANTP